MYFPCDFNINGKYKNVFKIHSNNDYCVNLYIYNLFLYILFKLQYKS